MGQSIPRTGILSKIAEAAPPDSAAIQVHTIIGSCRGWAGGAKYPTALVVISCRTLTRPAPQTALSDGCGKGQNGRPETQLAPLAQPICLTNTVADKGTAEPSVMPPASREPPRNCHESVGYRNPHYIFVRQPGRRRCETLRSANRRRIGASVPLEMSAGTQPVR
jgi:hypothetical protein